MYKHLNNYSDSTEKLYVCSKNSGVEEKSDITEIKHANEHNLAIINL